MPEPMKDFSDPALAYLAATDTDLAALIRRVGAYDLTPKTRVEPYAALIEAIAHQQLHGRAAEAIFGRFLALYPNQAFPSADSILATDESLIRGCGFSANKVATVRGIAEKTIEGVIPSRQDASILTDEELITRLTTLRGVGRWTVEMLLIFTLERIDVLPVDDFGVREGWRLIKSLPAQPKPKQLARIGEAWSPYRSIVAFYLWRAADAK